MKFRKMLAIPLFVVALTTAVFADQVAVDYDHAANFNQIGVVPHFETTSYDSKYSEWRF